MQTQQPSGASGQTGSKTGGGHRRARLALITLGVLLLLAVAVVAFVIWRQRASTEQAANGAICTSSLIEQASPAIANNDFDKLESLTTTITHRSGFADDVNCDYIVTRYYIAIGNTDQAQSSLNSLKQAYVRHSYSTAFDPPAMSPNAIQASIDEMKQQDQDQQHTQSIYDATDGVSP